MKNKLINCFIFFTALCSKAQTTDLGFLGQLKDSCKFYFSGEYHSNTSLENDYDLLMYLYTNNNVRVLVLEAPQEYEYSFNQYVTTADTDTYFISHFADHLRFNSRPVFLDYLKKIRTFNASLKNRYQKISIVCADINYSLSNALYDLTFIEHDEYASYKEILKCLREAEKIGLDADPDKHIKSRIELASQFKYLLDMREEQWKVMYQKNFPQIKMAIHALYRNAEVYYKYGIMSLPPREEIIYENIMEAYKENPDVSYFGNFGQMHTLLNCNVANLIKSDVAPASSMANELNKTEGLEHKVCTMPYYYLTQNNKPILDGKEFEDIVFLTQQEVDKYKKMFDAEGKPVYVPINKLQKADELEDMFNFIIITR